MIAKSAVVNAGSNVTGSGTNYTLTTSFARIDFGTTDVEISLTAGTYLLIANVVINGDASGAGDDILVQFFDATGGASFGVNAEQRCSQNSDVFQLTLSTVFATASTKTVQLYAKNATSARGTIVSTQMRLSAVRLL
jgi:hypothetical protein